MATMYNNEITLGLHEYDGYPGEPIWESKENYSTYYDYMIDKQCKVPIRDISEVKAELEAKYSKI